VGEGEDSAVAQARREEEFAARSPWVVELTTGDNALGHALLEFAGGRGFRHGRGVRLNDSGMASRAARYVKARRGVVPSDTSLDDAAAAACMELVKQVHVWEYVLSIPGDMPAERIKADVVIRSHLAECAWRAAFASFDDDAAASAGPTTGRHAREIADGVSLSLDAGQLASQFASLQAWSRQERAIDDTTPAEHKRAVCSWLWRSLVPGKAPGASAARARECAIKRARFLVALVRGEAWSEAARLAGFADGAAASKVLAVRQTWAALARAQAAESGSHPLAVSLRAAWWRAAKAEVKARRAARVWLRTSAARGGRGGKPRAVRALSGEVRDAGDGFAWRRDLTPLADGGGVLCQPWRLVPVAVTGGRTSGKVAALRVDIGAAAARAITRREQAARLTALRRTALVQFHDAAARDWQSAFRGTRRGWLR
jgi:hypothetical protein